MISKVRPSPYSLRTRDENDAIRQALAILNEPTVYQPETWDFEVKAYLQEGIKNKAISPSFEPTRRMTLESFGQRFEVNRPNRVTPAMVQSYYDELRAEGLMAGTAQGYVFSLRAFFNWLIKCGRARTNPAVNVTMERVVRYYNHRTCTKQEVDALISECRRDDLKFVLLSGFDAGLRRNEISEAVPAWFATPGIIHLQNSADYELKDGEARYIPLTDRFKRFLIYYGTPSPFMLHSEVGRGAGKYRYDIRRPFEDYLAEISQKKLNAFKKQAHDFTWITQQTMRHTFASLRVQKGISIYKVAKWLGDGLEVVQRHYGHLAPSQDADIEI